MSLGLFVYSSAVFAVLVVSLPILSLFILPTVLFAAYDWKVGRKL